jgi:hypothetical protein
MRYRRLAILAAGLALAAPLACNGGGSTTTDTGDASTDAQTTADPGGSTTEAPTSSTTAPDTASTTLEPTSTGDTAVSKRVFVTSRSFHGDLKSQGAGSDGVDGADRLCAEAAEQAGLDGSWIAWVSSSEVDALTRLASDGRWTLLDETTEVFATRSDIQFGPDHAIDMVETGESLIIERNDIKVWTNTDSFGAYSGAGQNNACDDWSAQTGVAAVGVLFDPELGGGAGLSWTDTQQPQACGGTYHLYCFEQ